MIGKCFHLFSGYVIKSSSSTHNIEPNLPAPISPTWIGSPAAWRSASLVDRLVIVRVVNKFDNAECSESKMKRKKYQTYQNERLDVAHHGAVSIPRRRVRCTAAEASSRASTRQRGSTLMMKASWSSTLRWVDTHKAARDASPGPDGKHF